MPVPPLTSQLISRIVGHVADGLDEAQRHEEGARLALVGKAWVVPARDLAWFIVTLEHGGSSPLMDHLLEFPHLLKHIETLEFEKLTASCNFAGDEIGDIVRDMHRSSIHTPAQFVVLMNSCCGLRSLALPCCDPSAPFLDILKTMPSKAKLSSLSLGFMSARTLDVTAFVNRLKCLSNLATLNIWGGLLASTKCSAGVTSAFKLPVQALSFCISGQTPAPDASCFTHGLLASFDLSCLRSVTLDEFDGHTSILEHLPECANLSSLRIVANSPIMLQLALSSLVPGLPDLQALEDIELTTVEIDFNAFQADSERLPSPLPLDTLLEKVGA